MDALVGAGEIAGDDGAWATLVRLVAAIAKSSATVVVRIRCTDVGAVLA
jgi:hypothetical protein